MGEPQSKLTELTELTSPADAADFSENPSEIFYEVSSFDLFGSHSSEMQMDLFCPEDGRLDSTGPTLREYEQQLKKLSDENENLKLKIFFVEERLKTFHGIFDVEDLLKKNAELEVNCESQTKELQKKEELLFEASKAYGLLQKEHKKEIEKLIKEKETVKCELEEKVSDLEVRLEKLNNRLCEPQLGTESEEDLRTSEGYKKQVSQLKSNLENENERSRALEDMMKDNQLEQETYNFKLERLEHELRQRMHRVEELVEELERKEHDLAEANFKIRKIEDEMSTKQREDEIMKDKIAEKDKVIVLLKGSFSSRDVSIADLDNRLAKERSAVQSLMSKLDSITFENIRLKEEVTRLQARMRRNLDLTSSSSRATSTVQLEEDGYRQKYENISRSMEEHDELHMKKLKELEEKLSEKNTNGTFHQELLMKHKKLENEHKKACAALKNFMQRSVEEKKERCELAELLEKQQGTIEELKQQLEPFHGCGLEEGEGKDEPEDLTPMERLQRSLTEFNLIQSDVEAS